MFNFEDILRGYSPEQAAEAQVTLLVNFLHEKGIIDRQEYFKEYNENYNTILNKVVERDREESKKKYEEHKAKENK